MPTSLPEQPPTPVELLKRAIDSTHEADEEVSRAEGAIDSVKRGDNPHFDTELADLAKQYEAATKAIEKQQPITVPSGPTIGAAASLPSDPKAEAQLGADSEALDYQLRAALADAESMENSLNSEIELSARKVEAAKRMENALQNLLVPGTPMGNKAAPYWADADSLARAIANYKSALERRRANVRAAISELKQKIDNVGIRISLIRMDVWEKFWQQQQENARLNLQVRAYEEHEEEIRRDLEDADSESSTPNSSSSRSHEGEGKQGEPNNPSDHNREVSSSVSSDARMERASEPKSRPEPPAASKPGREEGPTITRP